MRQRFPEGKGWVIERIWSRDWWKDPGAEVERIDGIMQTRVNEDGQTAAPAGGTAGSADGRVMAVRQPPAGGAAWAKVARDVFC